MTTEYRVIGSGQTAAFGPTKNQKTALSLLSGRRAQYGDSHPWGPWRLQEREVGDWHDVTGTLFDDSERVFAA